MRILCVDDDGLVLAVTADLLRALGHDVEEAPGGRHAAQLLSDGARFDLLVTDIHMPGGPGGREIADLARRTQPELAVIYFSGVDHVTPADARDIVLRKPCRLGELQNAISGVMAA